MGADMRADRGTGRPTDRRHPARVFLRPVLRLLIHRVGIARRDQPENVITIDARDRHFVGDRAEIDRYPIGQRGADTVAHLDMVAIDRDFTLRRELDPSQRTIGPGAVVLGHTGGPGADENTRLRG